MANTARAVIRIVDFVDAGNSISITFQNDDMGGEVSIFETAKNERISPNQFKIKSSLAETAQSLYDALLADYGWLSQVGFTVENDRVTIIASDYGSSFTGSSNSANITAVSYTHLTLPTTPYV